MKNLLTILILTIALFATTINANQLEENSVVNQERKFGLNLNLIKVFDNLSLSSQTSEYIPTLSIDYFITKGLNTELGIYMKNHISGNTDKEVTVIYSSLAIKYHFYINRNINTYLGVAGHLIMDKEIGGFASAYAGFQYTMDNGFTSSIEVGSALGLLVPITSLKVGYRF